MINSKDISVVIQGKNIKGETKKCCQSIRKWLPGAEIIFSTYTGEDVSDLDIDVLVESTDPGATLLSGKMYNNINRILTTTQTGLKKANRLYCIKMRSDLFFDNNKILNDIAEQFPKRDKKYSIFKKRVLFYPLWSRKSEMLRYQYFLETPFYLSDWFCFGLTEDIKNYFLNCPMTKEPDYSNYYKIKKNRLKGFSDLNVCWRFSPEQWFCMNFFKRYFSEAKMLCSQDTSKEKVEFSDRVLANNIVIAGYDDIGVYIQKKEYLKVSKNTHKALSMTGPWLEGVNTHLTFLKDYKKYCDPDFVIPFRYRWTQDLRIDGYITHLQGHIKKLFNPIKTFFHWFDNVFGIVYYIVKIIFKTIYWGPYIVYKEIKK